MGKRTTDQELVQRVQRGDKRAFDLLVLKYQQRIIHLISRFIRSPSDVEDIAQEAFIKAYRALPNFRKESTFYTWMYRIAVNTAKNHLLDKSGKIFEFAQRIDNLEQTEGNLTLTSKETPEHLLLRDEIQTTILDAIEALPEELKIAITLREFENLSYEEIAKVMDCPLGTVRSRIFRAREAIDSVLQPLLEK